MNICRRWRQTALPIPREKLGDPNGHRANQISRELLAPTNNSKPHPSPEKRGSQQPLTDGKAPSKIDRGAATATMRKRRAFQPIRNKPTPKSRILPVVLSVAARGKITY
jgi:hypothetical protein